MGKYTSCKTFGYDRFAAIPWDPKLPHLSTLNNPGRIDFGSVPKERPGLFEHFINWSTDLKHFEWGALKPHGENSVRLNIFNSIWYIRQTRPTGISLNGKKLGFRQQRIEDGIIVSFPPYDSRQIRYIIFDIKLRSRPASTSTSFPIQFKTSLPRLSTSLLPCKPSGMSARSASSRDTSVGLGKVETRKKLRFLR